MYGTLCIIHIATDMHTEALLNNWQQGFVQEGMPWNAMECLWNHSFLLGPTLESGMCVVCIAWRHIISEMIVMTIP